MLFPYVSEGIAKLYKKVAEIDKICVEISLATNVPVSEVKEAVGEIRNRLDYERLKEIVHKAFLTGELSEGE
jgi:hypothetical protein